MRKCVILGVSSSHTVTQNLSIRSLSDWVVISDEAGTHFISNFIIKFGHDDMGVVFQFI